MIFIAKNEDGEPAWKLAMDGKKTVTRRLKSLPVGKEFAIQPGRGKFAVCRGKVISCMNSMEHYRKYSNVRFLKEYIENEAHLEGFNSWNGLMQFFQEKKIQFTDTNRIEYELIKENE